MLEIELSKAQCINTVPYHRETTFTQIIVPFIELHYITQNHRYSSAIFKYGKRKANNCIGFGNLFICDIDNDRVQLSLDEAVKQFSDITSLIVTTKSHQIEKNNQTTDRYRIIIPMTNNLEIDKEDYPDFYIYTSKLLGINEYIDTACKDVARMYQPNLEQLVHYSNSKNIIDSEMIVESFYEYKEEKTRRNKPSIGAPSNPDDSSKLEYLRSISCSSTMLKLLNYYEKFVEGNRNTFLYSAGRYLIDSKLTRGEVRDALIWMNSLQNGIPQQELEKTVMRSLKI